jgi:hypothetical protein
MRSPAEVVAKMVAPAGSGRAFALAVGEHGGFATVLNGMVVLLPIARKMSASEIV